MSKHNVLALLGLSFLISSFGFSQSLGDADYFIPPQKPHAISPANQDGMKDGVDLRRVVKKIPTIPVKEVYFKVYSSSKKIVRSITEIPAKIDETMFIYYGKADNGRYLSDGSYYFTLGFSDDKDKVHTSPAYPFEIDNTTPKISLAELSGDSTSVTIRVNGSAEVEWRYIAQDNMTGKKTILFEQKSQDDPQTPPKSKVWVIADFPDSLVALIAGIKYNLLVEARDQAGNVSSMPISSQVMVMKNKTVQIVGKGQYFFEEEDMFFMDEETRLLNASLPSLYYPAYSTDLFSQGESELLYQNLRKISEVVRALLVNPEYKLRIIGHAASISISATGALSAVEQEKELIPLSEGRADQVKRGFIMLGINPERIFVLALGGSKPAIIESDESNIWKNRRVEFQLYKE